MGENENPKEKRHWSFLEPRSFASMQPEDYILNRINQFREWYDTKASRAKKNYLTMQAVTVIGGAVVPILINVSSADLMKYITSAISLTVVVLVSLESVFHFREQWKNYRSTEQTLAKEYFNFSTGDGAYRNMKKDEAFLKLVERVENAIESENASTLNVMTTLTDAKTESKPADTGPGNDNNQ
jgi:hypothetical protein